LERWIRVLIAPRTYRPYYTPDGEAPKGIVGTDVEFSFFVGGEGLWTIRLPWTVAQQEAEAAKRAAKKKAEIADEVIWGKAPKEKKRRRLRRMLKSIMSTEQALSATTEYARSARASARSSRGSIRNSVRTVAVTAGCQMRARTTVTERERSVELLRQLSNLLTGYRIVNAGMTKAEALSELQTYMGDARRAFDRLWIDKGA